MTRRGLLVAALAVGTQLCVPLRAPLGAQRLPDRMAAAKATVVDTAPTTFAPLFVRRDAYIAVGFAVSTVALFPFDERVAAELQEPESHATRFVSEAATDVEYVADPGAIIIGVGMYAVGRVFHIERAADLGLHGTEAVIAGGAVTAMLKGLTGRSRPYVSADTNPRDFKFGRGFGSSDHQSFPSGHTTSAFAAAAAVTYETHSWWPRSTWIVAPLLYGGAAMVGASRVYHDRHWASDVILGAGIGTFSGLKVVRFNHRTRPGNWLDRVLL